MKRGLILCILVLALIAPVFGYAFSPLDPEMNHHEQTDVRCVMHCLAALPNMDQGNLAILASVLWVAIIPVLIQSAVNQTMGRLAPIHSEGHRDPRRILTTIKRE